jgi:hypothetical protein
MRRLLQGGYGIVRSDHGSTGHAGTLDARAGRALLRITHWYVPFFAHDSLILEASALIFRVQGWVDDPVRRGACIDGLNTAIYKALGKAEIEIPFPQLVAHQAPRPTSGS